MAAIIPLTILAAIFQSFFMGLFFFIGGYFSPGSYDRKGLLKFLVDRLKRPGIPCVLFFYAIGPLTLYLTQKYLDHEDFVYRQSNHIGTMWFAQALLLFSIIYALGRGISRVKPKVDDGKPLPAHWQFALVIILMASFTFLVRYFYPRGTGRWGMIFGDFPQYILMFTAGIIAYRNNWLASIDGRSTKWLKIGLGVLILLLPVMMVSGEDPIYGFEFFMGGLYWQAAAYATWESFMCVVVSMILLQVFMKKYNNQGKLTAGMSASAYTVYIIHPVVLVIGSILLLSLPLHPLLKFALLVPFGILITFPFAGVIKKLPVLRNIL